MENISRYTVELLDEYMKLQKIANDHMIRAIIQFEGRLDNEILKKSIRESFKLIPILRSEYIHEGKKVFWEEITYSDDEFINFSDGNPDEANLAEYLTKAPKSNGPKIYFQLIKQKTNDMLIIIVNHMAFDGTGFKEYLYLLAEIYSHLSLKKTEYASSINNDRRMSSLLKNISAWEKFKSLFRKTLNTKGVEVLTEDTEDLKTRIRIFKIDPESFRKIKAICTKKNVTINDFILALFSYSIFNASDCKKDASISMQIMIDLRRYQKKYAVSRFGNFSSMESISITNTNEDFGALADEISRCMNSMKLKLPGIKNILLMNFLFKVLPRSSFDKILSKTIKSLGISTSNLGLIDGAKLKFGENNILDAYILTSLKNQPAFQLTFSTFSDCITLGVLGNYSSRNWEIIEGIMNRLVSTLDDILNNQLLES